MKYLMDKVQILSHWMCGIKLYLRQWKVLKVLKVLVLLIQSLKQIILFKN